jgi:hypothetical protein
MNITYKQHGATALILEDGKAICTALYADGVWTANFHRQTNETRFRANQGGCSDHHTATTLDRLCFEMAVRPHGCWAGGPPQVWG